MISLSPQIDRLEPEINLISICIDDARRLHEVTGEVEAEHFSQPEYQTIWRWLLDLSASGKPVTMYSLSQAYGNRPEYQFLRENLRGLSDGIIPLFAKQYAQDVRRHARRADAQMAIARLKALADSSDGIEEIEEAVAGLFNEVVVEHAGKGIQKIAEVVAQIEDDLANPQRVDKFPTGFKQLDQMIGGGFRPAQLIVVGGGTGGGKSMIALNFAANVAKIRIPCAVFSLEMGNRDAVLRMLFCERETTGAGAFDTIRNLPVWLDDTAETTARGIASKIKLLAARSKVKIVIVDYLQLLGSDQGPRETRERIVADMSRTLKLAAKQAGVVVVALSQLNADGELRESRAVAQDADVVLTLVDLTEEDVTDDAQKKIFLRVTKNRAGQAHGPIHRAGEKPGIPLRMDGRNFRFTES